MGHVNERSETQARIVRYWRAVEYFSPPKVDPVDPEKGVRPVHHGRSLPWEPGVLGSPGDKKVWRHTVYAGIFNIGKTRCGRCLKMSCAHRTRSLTSMAASGVRAHF
jgi:hypothetical protein